LLDMHLTVYGLISPLSCVPFVPNFHSLCQLSLSFLRSNVTAPSSTQCPPSRHWIQFTDLPTIRAPICTTNVPVGVCRPRTPTHPLPLIFPCTRFARSLLVHTALDLRINHPLAPIFSPFSFTWFDPSPSDRQQTEPTRQCSSVYFANSCASFLSPWAGRVHVSLSPEPYLPADPPIPSSASQVHSLMRS
jgi:hypothetical protein